MRQELEPLIDEVMEHAVFRSRVMLIARDALQRFRVEMAAMQFDLDVTKRERSMGIVLTSDPAAFVRRSTTAGLRRCGGGKVSQVVTTRPTSARLSAEQFSGRSSALCQYG